MLYHEIPTPPVTHSSSVSQTGRTQKQQQQQQTNKKTQQLDSPRCKNIPGRNF